MAFEAVSDTGPLIHLSQIEKLELLKIVDKLLISSEVKDGFRRGRPLKKIGGLDIIEVKEAKGTHADSAGALSRKCSSNDRSPESMSDFMDKTH